MMNVIPVPVGSDLENHAVVVYEYTRELLSYRVWLQRIFVNPYATTEELSGY